MHLIVMEITLLIMENRGKIMELCFRIFVETLTYIICLFQVCHRSLYGGLPILLVSALGDWIKTLLFGRDVSKID